MTPPTPDNKSSWLKPSLTDWLVLISFSGYIFLLPQIKSFDIWWHLETGKLILSGVFPKVDVLSFTVAGQPWTLHEWGSEVLFYWLFKYFGATGLVTLRAIIAALTVGCFYRLLTRHDIHPLLAFVLTMGAAVLFHKSWNMRPHIFSLFFLVLVFYLVNEYSRHGRSRMLGWLPLIFLLWINLHGGFVVGFLFLGLWVTAETINIVLDGRAGKNFKCLGPLILWSGLSFLAAFANPHTYQGVLYPLLYSGNSDLPLNAVAEWHPASWDNSKYFIFYTVFVIAVLFLSRARLPAGHLLLIAVFGLYAFRYHRITSFYAAVSLPLVGIGFQHLLRRSWERISRPHAPPGRSPSALIAHLRNRSRQIESFGNRPSRHILLVTALVISVGLLLSGKMNGLVPLGFNKYKYPFDTIWYLGAHSPEGNIFNRFRWGGMISWCIPGKKVFIDGRIDVYGKKIIEEYDTVLNLNDGWRDILEKYNITHILMNPEAPLSKHITELDNNWHLVAKDDLSMVFFKFNQDKPDAAP